jgi:hypothetical protein
LRRHSGRNQCHTSSRGHRRRLDDARFGCFDEQEWKRRSDIGCDSRRDCAGRECYDNDNSNGDNKHYDDNHCDDDDDDDNNSDDDNDPVIFLRPIRLLFR